MALCASSGTADTPRKPKPVAQYCCRNIANNLLLCCYFAAVFAAVISLFRRCYLPLFFARKDNRINALRISPEQKQRPVRICHTGLLRGGDGTGGGAAQFRAVVAARQEGLDVAGRLAQALP